MTEFLEKRVTKIEDRLDIDENKQAERDEKLNSVLVDIRIMLNNINNTLKNNDASDLAFKTQLEKLDARIKCLEDMSTINWQTLLKNGIITFLSGGGILYIILLVLDKIK